MKTEIRIGGFGGQGVILAGIILGKSACLFDGKEAVQTQSYGPEARGGASKCEVVIGDSQIDYPKETAYVLIYGIIDIYRIEFKKSRNFCLKFD